MQIETVTTDSFAMKYFKFGTGKKTAVILPGISVKSVTNSAYSISSLYKALKQDYTVYVFDRRETCPEDYTIEGMAEDTAIAFDVLGLSRVYLFGLSQGGMIAQCIAINRPDLVCKLALCSTIPRVTESNSRVLEKWISLAEVGDEQALNRSIASSVFSDELYSRFEGFILQLMSGATEEDIHRFLILAKGCRGFDVTDKLHKIKCPVRVVATKADKVFDFEETVLIPKLIKAELYVYENYGHTVCDEAPDFQQRLLEFFGKSL